jgi:hypothetical protein
LTGSKLPGGADWVTNRTNGVMLFDVRLMLSTYDAALDRVCKLFAKG